MAKQPGLMLKWIGAVAAGVVILLLIRMIPLDDWSKTLREWIESLGAWGPVAYALVYVVATVCFIPGSVITLLAGAIFGLWVGFVTVSIGSILGASLAFLIARYLARAQIESLAKTNSKFAAIDAAISEGGWKIVGMLRLSPALPFNLQNYLFGLTDIPFWPYALTSWIAMIPGTFLYVYLGHAAGSAAAGGKKSPAEWALLAVGLLATVAVTVYITRLAKKQLDSRTDENTVEG